LIRGRSLPKLLGGKEEKEHKKYRFHMVEHITKITSNWDMIFDTKFSKRAFTQSKNVIKATKKCTKNWEKTTKIFKRITLQILKSMLFEDLKVANHD
jgi:hypothetical protein